MWNCCKEATRTAVAIWWNYILPLWLTRYCVIKEAAEKPSHKHMGGQQYLHHLVDQFHTWVAREERKCQNTFRLMCITCCSHQDTSQKVQLLFFTRRTSISRVSSQQSRWKLLKNNDICWQVVPVLKKSGFFKIQFGMTSAVNMEKPKINIFLEEFISVDWKIDMLNSK